MREKFPGYFTEALTDFQELWKESLIVLDANVLLNFYRYSDTTRETLLAALNKYKERLWVPHRAAYEYLINRLDVIAQQQKKYDSIIGEIDRIKRELEGRRQHPFVSDETLEKSLVVFDELTKELRVNRDVHSGRIYSDSIKIEIDNLIQQNVGDPYSEATLQEIIVSGQERFKGKIPPGYKDGLKKVEGDGGNEKARPYGDYIIWLQIIDKAKAEGKSVMLITDDGKEDWWEIFQGKTIGPRPELTSEFRQKVGKDFFMYQPDQFLARAGDQGTTPEDVLEEIRDVRESSQVQAELSIESTELPWESIEFPWESETIASKEVSRRSSIEDISERIAEIEYKLADLNDMHNKLEFISTSSKSLATKNQARRRAEHIRELIAESTLQLERNKELLSFHRNSWSASGDFGWRGGGSD